jgi:hypothetical protein
MSPPARRNFLIFLGLLVVTLLCWQFPRFVAFAELAARELRYFWWLVLIAAIGLYLAFFTGRKDR